MARIARNRPGSRKGTPVPPLEAVSDLQKKRFLEEFAREHNITNALRKGGFDSKWLKRLKAEDRDFLEAYRAIDREWIHKVERKGYDMAVAGDGALIRFILSTRLRKKYGSRTEVDVKVEDITKLSDEELAEMVAKWTSKRS